MDNCFRCPVKTDNRSLKQQIEKLQASALYKSYEESKEYGMHWHDKWYEEHELRMSLSRENKDLKKAESDHDHQKNNLIRGLERRDTDIQTLKQENNSLKLALEESETSRKSAEEELAQFRELFGSLDEVFSALKESAATPTEESGSSASQSPDPAENTGPEISPEEKKQLETELQEVKEKYVQAEKELKEVTAEKRDLEKKLNRNSKNSSVPSSAEGLKKGKIRNNRESSGKKPGGQPGHKGHRLQLFPNPDKTIYLESDPKFQNKRYKLLDKQRTKQFVDVHLKVSVIEFTADVYQDRKTGHEVSGAEFPGGMVNEVTYGPGIKTMAMFLHTIGNMPYRKVQEFLKEGTDNQIRISLGELVNLEQEFSERTQAEREEIMDNMFRDPFMHIDASVYRCRGTNEHVLVLASKSGVLYFNAKNKGGKLVMETDLKRDKPNEKIGMTEKDLEGKRQYKGVLVHDSEAEFFHYALIHQLCIAHELRYLRAVEEDEGDVEWAGKLRKVLKDCIEKAKEEIANAEERKSQGDEAAIPKFDQSVISQFRSDYEECIQLGEKEYEKLQELHSESFKYRDGPKVLKRLKENEDGLLYFLNDLTIPYTDNFEKCLRVVKMHGKQCGGYWSSEAVRNYLNSLGILETERIHGGNRYQKIHNTFEHGKGLEPEILN